MDILDIDHAIASARTAANELKKLRRLKLAFENAVAGSPLLVQRIDREDSFYYIVTFKIGTRETGRIVLDAFDGTLHSAGAITETEPTLRANFSSTEAMGKMLSEANLKARWKTKLREGLIGQHPVLVWRPCRESSTPLLPFYQFSVGGSFVYLRLDGQVSESLTTGPV